MALRAMGALLFTALLALFLAQPVLDSNDEPNPKPPQAAGSPTKTPPLASRHAPDRDRIRRFVRTPFDCSSSKGGLKTGSDLVAAFDGNGVVLATLDGRRVARVKNSPPVAFSVSGVLATGPDGELWSANGAPWERGEQQLTLGSDLRKWGWSPVADCAATIDEGGRLSLRGYEGIPPGTTVTLAYRDAVTFSFSPDGTHLRFVTRSATTKAQWSFDLATGRIKRGVLTSIRRPPIACTTCSPGGDFRVGIRDERLTLFDAEGGFLRFITEIQTPNGVWGESAPEWGPTGTGVLFERHMHLVNQLWFIPERSSEPNFVVNLEPLAPLAGAFDWSATAPTGGPVRSVND